MIWTISGLKENSKSIIKSNYWMTVLVAFIVSMLVGGGGYTASGTSTQTTTSGDYYSNYHFDEEMMLAVMAVLGVVLVVAFIVCAIVVALSVFVLHPLEVGGDRFFMVNHYQPAKIKELGFAFNNSYMNVVKTMFFRALYIFLWSLLFIIPGIIKSYAYRLVPYILADNPEMNSNEALELSERMMEGHKWDSFVLDLSFIGWRLLGIIPVVGWAIQILWVNGYVFQTQAELYLALRDGGMSIPYCAQGMGGDFYSNPGNGGFNNGADNFNNNGFNNGADNFNNNGFNNGADNFNNNSFNNGADNFNNNGFNNGANNFNNNGFNNNGYGNGMNNNNAGSNTMNSGYGSTTDNSANNTYGNTTDSSTNPTDKNDNANW